MYYIGKLGLELCAEMDQIKKMWAPISCQVYLVSSNIFYFVLRYFYNVNHMHLIIIYFFNNKVLFAYVQSIYCCFF